MGLSSCRLVSPDNYPSPIASARASGALDVLNSASLYETFDDAIADCRLVVERQLVRVRLHIRM